MDQTLRRDFTVLSDNVPVSIKLPTPQILPQNSIANDKSSVTRQSIFATAWNLLHTRPLNLSRPPCNCAQNKSESSESKLHADTTNVTETGDDPNNNMSQLRSVNMVADYVNPSSINSAGPPSTTDSFHGINLHEAMESFEQTERPQKGLDVKTSSRLLNARLSSHSKLFIRDSKTTQKKSSDGINAILDCSSTSVGSTHRSSVLSNSPRCAYDYVKMLQDEEGCKVLNEFPKDNFRYDINPQDFTESVNYKSYTPVMKDIEPKSISKSFLDSVNEQIQQIKANQARERCALIKSIGEELVEEISGVSSKFLIEQALEKPTGTVLSTGTSKHTPIIDGNIRKKIKAETSIQTEHGSPSITSSPSPWGIRSRIDSQMTILPNDQRKLGCLTYSPSPLQSSLDQRQVLRRVSRSSSFFGRFLNFNDALGITSYSLQAAWNTADEIFRHYIIPQELNENTIVSNEEVLESDNIMAMSVMKLLGFPIEARYAIYREVLQEIQVIHDFSVGTVKLLSHMIDSICSGNHKGADDLINKTRFLATCQTEVDPESESWGQFEKSISVFSEAVGQAVGAATLTVSRQCTESSDNHFLTIDHQEHESASVQEADLEDEKKELTSAPTSTANIDESIDDTSIDTNVNVISGLVTDSEFEFRSMTPIPRTESQDSNQILMRKKSRIPLPVPTNHLIQSEDSVNRQTRGRRNLTPHLASFKNEHRVVICNKEEEDEDSMYQHDEREKYLSVRDVELFRECRRLTALKTAADCRMSESSSIVEASDSISQSCVRDLTGVHAHRMDMTNADLSDIASAMASVASSVTSTLLNQAHSAASYIPSFNSFGPHEHESPNTIESPVLGSIHATEAGRGIVFKQDCTNHDCNHHRVQSTNQFLVTPQLYSPYSDESSRPFSNDSEYLESEDLSQLNGHETYYQQVQEHDGHYDSKTNVDDNDNDEFLDDSTAAWELFDYIKFQEAELAQTRQTSDSGSQISVQSGKSTVGGELNESLTARLSKAALNGLYNSFKESIPSPLITINYNNSENEPVNQSPFSIRHQNNYNENLVVHDNFMPGLKESRILKTPSGHSYVVNARHSSIYNNLNDTSTSSVSRQKLKVPTNSHAEFNKQLTQDRMYQDIAYLEKVLDVLKKSNLVRRYPQISSRFASSRRQVQPHSSRIPMKKQMSMTQPRNGAKSSAITVPLPEHRPRILHTRQSISNRTVPVKPKLQIINAVPISNSQNSQYSSRICKPSNCVNNTTTMPNYMKPSGGSNSYREMFQKNQPIAGSSRSRTSYSSSTNYSNENSHCSSNEMKCFSVDRSNSVQRQIKAKVSAYKYDDGTHEVQVSTNNSSKCSSTCSSGQSQSIFTSCQQ